MERNRMDRRRGEYRRSAGTNRLTPEQRAAERRQAARRRQAVRAGGDPLDRRMNAARMRAAESARRASRANGKYRNAHAGASRQRAGADRLTGLSAPRSVNRPSAYSGRGRGSVPATRDIHRGASRNSVRKRVGESGVPKQFNPPKPPIRKIASATKGGASAAVDFLRRSIVSPIGGAVSSSLEGRRRNKPQPASSGRPLRETAEYRAHTRKPVRPERRVEGGAAVTDAAVDGIERSEAGHRNDSSAHDVSAVSGYASEHEDAHRVSRMGFSGLSMLAGEAKGKAAKLSSSISGRFSGISRRIGRLGTEVPDSTDDLVFCDRLPVMFYKMVAGMFVIAVFGFCLVSWVMPDKDFSAEENRTLASFPSFSMAALQDASFMQGLEDWNADQFVGRNTWTGVQVGVNRLLNKKEFNGVFLGKDDYLIQAPTEPDYEQVDANIAAINQFVSRNPELSMNMIVVPNACTTMADWLPKGAAVHDQQKDKELLQSDCSVPLVDVDGAISENVDSGMYYRTDHHWTSEAARLTLDAAAGSLGIEPVSDYETITVTDGFQGTLASTSGIRKAKDDIQVLVPKGVDVRYTVRDSDNSSKRTSVYDSEKLQEKDKYQVFFGGNHAMVDIQTTVKEPRRLLVVKDSYANAFVPLLIPYFNEIVMVDPRYYTDDIDTLVSSKGITDVLFLYNMDTFMTDTDIDQVFATPEETEKDDEEEEGNQEDQEGEQEA